MQYNDAQIKDIRNNHGKWLRGDGGSRADLSRADLSRANLKETFLDGINWLAYLGIVPDSKGTARAYKVTDLKGEGVYKGGINYTKHKSFVASLDKDNMIQCGSGVNLATLSWCLNEKREGRRLFLMSFKGTPENVCAPIGTDGKFRVAHCTKIGECDWHGNLLPKVKES